MSLWLKVSTISSLLTKALRSRTSTRHWVVKAIILICVLKVGSAKLSVWRWSSVPLAIHFFSSTVMVISRPWSM